MRSTTIDHVVSGFALLLAGCNKAPAESAGNARIMI